MELEIEELIYEEELEIEELICEEEIEVEDVELDVEKQEVVTSNYEKLNNLPQINSINLIGNKTAKELSLQGMMNAISNIELEEILK